MHDTHPAREERYYLFQGLKSGKSLRQLAREINRSASTVSRELRRNRGFSGYRHHQAEKESQKRQSSKGYTRILPQTWFAVERMPGLYLFGEQQKINAKGSIEYSGLNRGACMICSSR